MKNFSRAILFLLLFQLINITSLVNCSSSNSTCSSSSDCCPNSSCDECIPSNIATCASDTRNLNFNNNCSPCQLNCSCLGYNCGTTTFIPRSQGDNTARELVGWQKQLFVPYLCDNYASAALVFEYTKSFQPCRLAQRLFCTDCLTFSGSKSPCRQNGIDVVADYFGLAEDFVGTLKIKPKIENYIVDLEFFFGLDQFTPGFFARMHLPITHTRWSLGLDECLPCCNKFRGHDEFDLCYMNSNTLDDVFCPTAPQCQLHILSDPFTCTCSPTPNSSCFCTPQPAEPCPTTTSNSPCSNLTPPTTTSCNCTAQSLRVALSGNFTFGDMKEYWKFGRFNFCPNTKTGVADIDVIAGYNFIPSDFAHLALYAQAILPTGTRPEAKYIFEPIIGTGMHAQLGGGLSAHISLFNDRFYDGFNMGLWIEGNMTHMFKTHQKRSFDFTNNGLLSRYTLLKEFDVNNNYIGRMINAINFATRNAEVSISYKIDYSGKLLIQRCNWMFDFGYNFYFQSAEEVCIKTHCPCAIDKRRFGIKGTEGVCCTSYTITNGQIIAPAVSTNLLNATQPNATMFTVIQPTTTTINPAATSVCLAFNNPTITVNTPISGQFFVADTTTPPTIISCADLDPNSAAQQAMLTHKIFTHLAYVYSTSCYAPHIGIGCEVEFDGKCINNSLSQWGIWVKGGITF